MLSLKNSKKYTEIVGFKLFYSHFIFKVNLDGSREKTISDCIRVIVVIDLDYVNM